MAKTVWDREFAERLLAKHEAEERARFKRERQARDKRFWSIGMNVTPDELEEKELGSARVRENIPYIDEQLRKKQDAERRVRAKQEREAAERRRSQQEIADLQNQLQGETTTEISPYAYEDESVYDEAMRKMFGKKKGEYNPRGNRQTVLCGLAAIALVKVFTMVRR